MSRTIGTPYLLILLIFSSINATELQPLDEYGIFTWNQFHYKEFVKDYSQIPQDYLYTEYYDYVTGVNTVIDSIAIRIPRGFQWYEYDFANHRVFFERRLPLDPHQLGVLDLDAMEISELPFLTYDGYFEEFIVAPQSKYIIFRYLPVPIDTITFDMAGQDITVVLDGKSLKKLGERKGMPFWVRSSFILSNSKDLLYNIEYNKNTKASETVAYSLPDLIPIDTVDFYKIGWSGGKGISDISGDVMLISGFKIYKTDTSFCVFLYDDINKILLSSVFTLPRLTYTDIMLTPEADEIITVEKESGIIRRYSAKTGKLLGTIQGPLDSYSVVFREDGNLYITADMGETTVIDYKNNAVLKTIIFEEISR